MKRKILGKVVSVCLAVLLILSMPVQALAAEWNLENGSVSVNANESGQTVSQGETVDVPDSNPTITGTYTGAGPAITVETSGGATAELTIENVEITPSSGSGIEVGASDAIINVSGDNSVAGSKGNMFNASSVIHITSGDLEITSSDAGSLNVSMGNNLAAGIGGNSSIAFAGGVGSESVDGTITMSGNVQVTVEATGFNSTGAAVGSGTWGSMNGEVIFKDQATFETNCGFAAGAPASRAEGSDPTIQILDEAEVKLTNNNASIGTGTSVDSGKVVIEGTASVNGFFGSEAEKEGFFVAKEIVAEDPVKKVPSAPAADVSIEDETVALYGEPIYKTIDANGAPLPRRAYARDRILYVEVSEDYAQFVVIGKNLEILRSWNIEAVSFTTNGGTSLLSLDGLEGDVCLTHDGGSKNLTVGGVEKTDLLK